MLVVERIVVIVKVWCHDRFYLSTIRPPFPTHLCGESPILMDENTTGLIACVIKYSISGAGWILKKCRVELKYSQYLRGDKSISLMFDFKYNCKRSHSTEI